MNIPIEIASVIISSIISTVTAFFVANSTIKNQFKAQRELEIEKESKLNLVAFNSVRNEIVNNLVHLNRLIDMYSIIKSVNSDLDETTYYELMSVDRWNKYGDLIGIVVDNSDANHVESYYLNISLRMQTTYFNIEDVSLLIEDGVKARNIIDRYLDGFED